LQESFDFIDKIATPESELVGFGIIAEAVISSSVNKLIGVVVDS